MKTGRFLIARDRTVAGELRIAGSHSSLVIRDDNYFDLGREIHGCITGTLYDHTKISLIGCLPAGTATHSVEGVSSYSASVFPHFIAQGRVHLDPLQAAIQAVSFTFEDATTLFYDFDAFGALIDAAPHIDALTQDTARRYQRPIRTGPSPLIAYFAGQELIAEAATAIGRIIVRHHPSWPMGDLEGCGSTTRSGCALSLVCLSRSMRR